MEKIRGEFKIFMVKSNGKRPLGRLQYRWKDNIKLFLKEVGRSGVD